MPRKTVAASKSPKFNQSLPPFSGIPTLVSGLTDAVNTVIDDLHHGIIEDFMPIYSEKQRENINVAFERTKKDLKRTISSDAKTFVADIQKELQKVRV
jgi:hypothetical protein